MSRGGTRALAVGVALLATGCGAAYFGTALGIVASQKDKKVVDQSFPDAALFAASAPPFVRLQLSAAEVTITRDTTTFDPTGSNAGAAELTDHEILTFEFPPAYGVAISNRDAGTTIAAGDRLVVRINEDDAQEIVFSAADVASTGSAVAAAIEAKVRALTPASTDVPAEAYALFSASFDPSSRSYRFESGSPGETSEVAFEPAPRTSRSDDAPDAASGATAARLGLGVGNGGIETSGAETVSFVVLNRGTDVLPVGTVVNLFLSRDKVLNPRVDLPIDSLALDRPVPVGRALTFTRRNGDMPPVRLLRGDVLAGSYYLIVQIEPSVGEASLADNVLVAPSPLEVFQPVDDPATTDVEVANALDIVATQSSSPVTVVTGNTLPSVVTLTNVGAAVPAPGVDVDLDLVLSADDELDAPAAFLDPAGVVAGVRVNPTDPTRPFLLRVVQSGTNPLQAGVSGSVITVSYDGSDNGPTAARVADLIDALNLLSGTPVDAFSDGSGDPDADTVNQLLTAAGATEIEVRDVFVAHRRVTFLPAPRPLSTQTFVLEGLVRSASFRASMLPLKLTPMFLVRPRPVTGDLQDPTTDVRRATNFVRIYDRARATFDSVTGATLPTVNSDDFAALDAVTLRPVNTGSIRQGQQRVFRFEIPATGLTVDESQLLVILRTSNFDARIDLLSASGSFITGADDGPLGQDPMIYTMVQSNSQSRSFYLVVSTARSDESDLRGGTETFELTISVNPRRPTDLSLVAGVDGGNVLRRIPQSYAADEERTVNATLLPFSLANGKAEVAFVLPQRARVRFLTRPVFTVGVRTVITEFVKGSVPAPVSQQAVLDTTATAVVYRPSGGGVESSHVLDPGVYTVAFETSGGVPDTQDLRLEVSTLFLPD